jgi:hypothetical protein
MSSDRYMVRKPCLRQFFSGWEKSCSHGWDIMTNKPREGTCAKCGQHATTLHCPDGSELPPRRPLGNPLTLADRVRVVAAMLSTMQDDIYAGRYSEPGRPNITTIQHVLFESSEDLDSSREEMNKILDENRGVDAEICRALWPEETKS